ncbi:MAG TPA: histidine kinase [Ignavibacteriaceae bacterium]|nr:histidine kinase [Ignavibacteriaceae bacterium]
MLKNRTPLFHYDPSFGGTTKTTGAGIQNTMNRKKVYWLSQVIGWSIFVLVNILVIASFDDLSISRLFVNLYIGFTGVCLTHVYRNVIRKKDWLSLPLKKIIPRVTVSSIVIGLIMLLLVYAIYLQTGTYHIERIRLGGFLFNTFNLSSVILVWGLIYFSVHYFENYKKAEIEALIWEAAVKDFELKTLKSQLNPHFMFNALNSIRALIEEDPESAQTAVTNLSNILRYSLRIERMETVSLEDEMFTVEDYLELETIRFEERLRYKIKMDQASKKVEIPPMMVQTLVENGIKHGISKKREGGNISIDAYVKDSKLNIEIRNSGQFEEGSIQNAKGFGVSNTKHRLSLLYGENAIFSIKNESSDEVLTELVIPIGGTSL